MAIIFAAVNKNKRKRVLFLPILILTLYYTKAQDITKDILTFASLKKSRLSFILSDTYLIGGLNTSGIYYSNNFRKLSYKSGFSIGVEQYFPLKGKVFLSTGIITSQRNFSYWKEKPRIEINNLYLDIPITTAFELPILRNLDFRIFFGAVTAIRLNSYILGDYCTLLNQNSNIFLYQKSDFHSIDFGWHFGLSTEYKNILFRIRSFSGFVKFDYKDQGMMNSFNIEIGYFLFRRTNKRKHEL
ncbi:hypothetical protein AT05_01700 [Schleiferia thermophila str. Yellowstone]|uniref:outer membrane beta-barrel protein n=1 Tax=Schleiferia thermophila TaxID=884107 RepID=UPI0004E69074|nr:outer membrane beta-barrel protein [Schleiferia thermophila]KFD40321.1 hypothetical protein AT05_01700 [Schleiferia thermophila str. Yellowstone]